MANKRPRSLLWWWHVLVVMSAISWGTLVYFALVPPERKPWFWPYTFGPDNAAEDWRYFRRGYQY